MGEWGAAYHSSSCTSSLGFSPSWEHGMVIRIGIPKGWVETVAFMSLEVTKQSSPTQLQGQVCEGVLVAHCKESVWVGFTVMPI